MEQTELDVDPSEIAETVFNQDVQPPKTFQLFCQSSENEDITPVDVFEIFLTILMEGIFIKNNPVTEEKFKLFNENIILSLQPYLNSLGYKVCIEETDRNNEKLKKHYCRIVLKCDSTWAPYFEITHKNLEKEYHFILGGSSPYICGELCTLNTLFSIFEINHKVYKISFSYI